MKNFYERIKLQVSTVLIFLVSTTNLINTIRNINYRTVLNIKNIIRTKNYRL